MLDALIGRRFPLPPALAKRFPELAEATYRQGGLPLRIGGWCLGRSTVSGFTLWSTIWIAEGASPDAELLLHELRHVHQFQASPLFPIRYLAMSVLRGYEHNPYEIDAREFASRRLSGAHPTVKR